MADPSDILSAEQLEATVATVNGIKFGVSTLQARAIDRILRHLRALAAPADGEALGRILYEDLASVGVPPATWLLYRVGIREQHERAALHIHALSHAAGVLSREGEVAALRSEVARWRELNGGMSPDAAHEASAALIAEIRATLSAADAEIARLAAELASARDETTRWAAKEGIARAERDIAQTESARLKRREQDIIEACERVADGGQYRADIIGAINRIRSERDAARADGARGERERIMRKFKRIGYPDAVAAFERTKLRRTRGDR